MNCLIFVIHYIIHSKFIIMLQFPTDPFILGPILAIYNNGNYPAHLTSFTGFGVTKPEDIVNKLDQPYEPGADVSWLTALGSNLVTDYDDSDYITLPNEILELDTIIHKHGAQPTDDDDNDLDPAGGRGLHSHE